MTNRSRAPAIERIPRDQLAREGFRSGRRGRLIATDDTARAAGSLPAVRSALKALVLGRPLDTEAQEGERLSILKALPILASDALSSVAYGPEAGLSVLVAAGASALIWNVPLGIGIALLMVVVTVSYRQIVMGYAQGGGSYAVAKANLGRIAGLIAAGALLVDYVLTVAVSTSSGIDAVASVFPTLRPWEVPLCLACILLLVLANLRGLREAGTIFAGPTYLFIAIMLVTIVVGVVAGLVGHRPIANYASRPVTTSLTPFLLLTAFASGASSMTGIEAVSNTVPSFQKPQSQNAARTLTLLGALLVFLFLGVTALDLLYGAEPFASGDPTVLSQIGNLVFQGPLRPLYFVLQAATLLVLVLAANTSFNGFPRLGAILAHDHFLPMRFGYLGDRLVFSTSIVSLGVVAAILVIAFRANTDDLINLYALGVFTAFTLAQAAMARHWWRTRERGWQGRLAINGVGAVVTLVVDIVIIVTKTPRGAWAVIVVVPLLVLLFLAIARYYASVQTRLLAARPRGKARVRPWIAVPFFRLDRASEAAIAYAGTISTDVRAVHLVRSARDEAVMRAGWDHHWEGWPGPKPTLVRQSTGRGTPQADGRAVLAALRRLEEDLPGPPPETPGWVTTVVLPEWEPSNVIGSAARRIQVAVMKLILYRRFGTVVASLPTPGAGGVTADPIAAEPDDPADKRVTIVPVLHLDAPAMRALDYAQATSDYVIALHVEAASALQDEDQKEDPVEKALVEWRDAHPVKHTRIVIIESPARLVVEPVLAYVDTWRRSHPEPICTVVLPELFDGRWWAAPLHNHRALWLKAALLLRESVAVADVTFHLRHRAVRNLDAPAEVR
ncbi:MAG: APC family permease [Candidatus Dormibacteraceae bacterium]